jgi:hypothetical protein
MPVYSFYHGSHENERVASMSKIPKRIKCSCGEGWAKLGMSFGQTGFVRGAAINDKTKRDFKHVFKRGTRLETTRDVDAAFSDFSRRYPHLPPPGPQRRDPFPLERLGDNPNNNGE